MMQYMIVKPALSKDAELAEVPAAFELHQNYPNPFNPSTTIQFQLPRSGNVEIKIYDSLGQEVTKLIDQMYEAGIHSVQWNGTDSFGIKVLSGIYLYSMSSGDYKETRKMVMLK